MNSIYSLKEARIHYEGRDNFLVDFELPDKLISKSFD